VVGGFHLPSPRIQPETVVAHLGPTNSGKSHDALRFLVESGAGTYAAPLRLLAREAYERLAPLRPPGQVGLHTGEEQIDPDAPIVCCTTELVPRRGDVLVLDEVHWVEDPDRGWAWGRVLASAEYRHIRLVGAPNAERLVRAAYGECLEVRRHRRLVPLRWGGPCELAGVPAGSLVVAFSRRAVIALARDVAAASGLRTGVLYGALPPGTRRAQIERFVAGDLDVLCVTDVIGHGINLPARTVVMAETTKYDGRRRRQLHLWEVAQIIGRAGRFGLTGGDSAGEARVLRAVVGLDANATLVRQAVEASAGARAVGPAITHAPLRPELADLVGPVDAVDSVGPVDGGPALVAAVDAWEAGAARAFEGHPWLRPASLRPLQRALHALALARYTEWLTPATLWRLATLPVEDPDWIVEIAGSLLSPHRRLPPTARRDPAAWSLEEAEGVAARARGLAALANAFPGVGGLDRGELLGVEAAAADRINGVLAREVERAGFGRCRDCGRVCPPWVDTCDHCRGRPNAALRPARGGRGGRGGGAGGHAGGRGGGRGGRRQGR
jgi:ATP-dependent RNA helicase SUPV3L1/SUV3